MIKIEIQEMRTPHAVRSTNHQNTVRAPFERVMNARHMNAVCRSTQLYGIPQEVVLRKIFGAWPFSANA